MDDILRKGITCSVLDIDNGKKPTNITIKKTSYNERMNITSEPP